MTRAKEGGRIASTYSWAAVALRPLLVIGWIAAAIAAWFLLPTLGGSSTAPLDDIIPADAPALVAQQRALERFGSTLGSDTVIVQRNPRGLSQKEVGAAVSGAAAASSGKLDPPIEGVRAAIPLGNVPIPGVDWGETGTTALTYLFMGPELNLVERETTSKKYAATVLQSDEGTRTRITGAGPARLAQFREIEDVLPIITIATVLVIVLVVALYFRSFGAPLVTLLTAGVAYVVAIRVLGWSGERSGLTVPSEIEPVLVVLLLGLVTDYTIFFMSEARRRMLRGEPSVVAVRRATLRIGPIVFTAGVLVAGGCAALLAGRMEFFRVFGPGMAAAALLVTLVCLTFVPAVLALAGPRLFGRRCRDAARAAINAAAPTAADVSAEPPERLQGAKRERWRVRASGVLGALRASRTHAGREGGSVLTGFAARMLATRPASLIVAVLAVGGLAFAAYAARTVDLAVSHIPSLPADTGVRAGADDAARGLAPGVMAPTEVVVEQNGVTKRRDELAALQKAIAASPGVAAVLGPAQAVVKELEPVVLARDGGAARFAVFLSDEPTGADAINALGDLRERMPTLAREAGLPAPPTLSYAGETALAQETVDSIVGDLGRVAIAASIVTFLLLALFLRSLVAPALLLGGSILAFAASFGLMALALPLTLGGSDVVYYVPLVGAVLLIGLGSDYNVFIAGRIREEARRRRLREAIAVAAPSASRAITVAGITLAATFALLALVPLRPFRELALLMTIGVLVDALLVRPILIPALIGLAGDRAWWPSRPRPATEEDTFVAAVADRAGSDEPDARLAIEATLATLAERVPEREAHELAGRLPESIARPLAEADGTCEPFGAAEFIARVARRTQETPPYARLDVESVIATLIEVLPPTELDYVRAALSEDYRELFGDAPVPGAEPVAAG